MIDKLAAWVAALVFAAGCGALAANTYLHDEMAQLRGTYAKDLKDAQDAKRNAEARAAELEEHMTALVSTATAKYEKDQDAQHTQDARTIADLRHDVVRLSVRTNRPAGSGALPGPAAGAGSGDGAATETLAGPVAARLAQRYADYNGLVDQLTLCQAVVTTDRLK